MIDFFFQIEYSDIQTLIIKMLVLNAMAAFIVWAINILSTKMSVLSSFKLETRLRFGNCLGASALLLGGSIYFSALYIFNGAHIFHWGEFQWNVSNFYLQAAPQISLFVHSIVVFTRNYSALSSELTQLKN